MKLPYLALMVIEDQGHRDLLLKRSKLFTRWKNASTLEHKDADPIGALDER